MIYGISKKYEYLSRSDELYEEIIKVIDEFHEPLIFYSKDYISKILSC